MRAVPRIFSPSSKPVPLTIMRARVPTLAYVLGLSTVPQARLICRRARLALVGLLGLGEELNNVASDAFGIL